ncbi:TIGR04053 family radical SAM/SPASM domain-containing protein [Longirhabdus pacifica]|uniref:TIGR04053 family radical SAM/SPASM domain-containing protein n=1 Tax=Longirhabdus pacifica TaxID=2305227 RepID=UPI001008D04F|nr:TIGR04053 family radical SAM/SPASM domain-containing protein [Longirhabdus pacifica]
MSYDQSPFIVIWEITRACYLKCLHCRAEAQPLANPNQLSTEEGKMLLDQIAALDNPLLVFTGGDPLMRKDLYELIEYAIHKGLRVSMVPSATPLVKEEVILRAKEAGLSRWAFSVDGPNAEVHDRFRGTKGSFELTATSLSYLKKIGLPIQINTTVSRYNADKLEEISELVEQWGAILWSIFFLVPTGRGQHEDMTTPEENERIFEWIVRKKKISSYDIKTTVAPALRRVMLTNHQISDDRNLEETKRADILGRAKHGITDGNGFVFISHTGEVQPSGFLPIVCGNIRDQSLGDIYRNSPIFKDLRNRKQLKGKCGVCSFHHLCGGSRARAYAVHGDYMESDPACAYIPKGWEAEQAIHNM